MANHDEPEDRTPTGPPTFQYPTLAHHNPTSSSNPQAEEPMTSAFPDDRPPSSLSESWTTLSASDIQSEDDARSEQTDVASLVGRSVPDDVASLDDHEPNSEVESVVDSTCSDEQEHVNYVEQVYDYDSAASSTLTERTAFYNDSDVVEFEEPDWWPSSETAKVECTLRVFDDEATQPEFLRDLPCDGALTVNVRQTISKKSLDLDKPFRILYVGNTEHKQIVLDKIGDALAAGYNKTSFNGKQAESRFHVIPTSFGEHTDPSYAELVPLHLQLVVDECFSASSTVTSGGDDTIKLFLRGQGHCSSIKHGDGYDVASSSSWEPPDVAVLVVGDDENIFEVRRRQLAQQFAKRHQVPSIVVSQNPIWGNPEGMTPSDYESLHICVEYQDASTGETEVAGKYPIDLATFESIDASQLNRHLSSIRHQFVVSPVTSPPWFGQVWKDLALVIIGKQKEQALYRHFTADRLLGFASVMVLMVIAIVSFIGFLIAGIGSFSLPLPHTPHSVSEPTGVSSETTTNIVGSSLMPTPMSDVVLSACANQHSMDIDDYLAELTRPGAQSGNYSDNFQLHALGDSHIIIQPPTKSSPRKKPVEFDVKVSRGEERLPYSLSKLFDDVYSLRLNREHAYGTLNVSITTRTKPIFEQVTELDFGHPWLKLASWKKAARNVHSQFFDEINAAQTGLSVIYGRISTDLQVMSDNIRTEVQVTGHHSIQRALTTASSLVSKSKRLSKEFRREAEKRMAVSTRLLLGRYEVANREVFELANGAFSLIQKRAKKVRDDFSRLPGKFSNKKPRSLALAQKHAQKLVNEVREGWKSASECSKSKSSCKRR